MRQKQRTEMNGEKKNYVWLLIEENILCGENPEEEEKIRVFADKGRKAFNSTKFAWIDFHFKKYNHTYLRMYYGKGSKPLIFKVVLKIFCLNI